MSGLQIIKAALHAGMFSLMFSAPDNINICETQSDMETQGQTGTSRNDNSEIDVERHLFTSWCGNTQHQPRVPADHIPQQCSSTKKYLCMMLVPPTMSQQSGTAHHIWKPDSSLAISLLQFIKKWVSQRGSPLTTSLHQFSTSSYWRLQTAQA